MKDEMTTIWSRHASRFGKATTTKDHCLQLAHVVSTYLNDESNLRIIGLCPSFVEATTDGAEVRMSNHVNKYSRTREDVTNAARDYAAGYTAAQQATMERVAPHLKVSYKKTHPES